MPEALRETRTRLTLSIHHQSPQYQQTLQPIFELLRGWIERHRIQVVFRESFRHWTRRYHGVGAEMQPFEDSDPRNSWESCPAKYCPQLFEGKIWKCAPLAYLKMQDAKYALSDKWQPYLRYQPLPADCDEAQLQEFFDRQEESHCGMCPARPEPFRLPIPSAALARLPNSSEMDSSLGMIQDCCSQIDVATAYDVSTANIGYSTANIGYVTADEHTP